MYVDYVPVFFKPASLLLGITQGAGQWSFPEDYGLSRMVPNHIQT